MLNKIVNILSVGGRIYIPAILNLCISLIVVNWASFSLWGEYIGIVVYINLFSQLTFWGHREPLIRRLAKENNEKGLWHTWLWTRTPLLFVPLFYFLAFYQFNTTLIVIIFTVLLQYLSTSMISLIDFNKRFKIGLVGEVLPAFFVLVFLWYLKGGMTVEILLLSYAAQLFLKVVVYLILLHDLIFPFSIRFDWRLLKEGFPFFLALLGGFLNSRIDILFLEIIDNQTNLGKYHVLVNFLIQAQVIAGVMLIPKSRALYRLSNGSFKKLLTKWCGLGVLVSSFVAIILPFISLWFYRMPLSCEFSFAFFIFIFPSFPNQVFIYWCYRRRNDLRVVTMIYLGVLFQVILLGGAVFFDLELYYVFLATGCAKLLITFSYFIYFRLNGNI